jgi:hypothetical protein
MARMLRHWLGWFAALAGLYVLLVDTTKPEELAVAAAAAAAGATLTLGLADGGEGARSARPVPWAGGLAHAFARIPGDSARVTAALWRRVVQGRPVHGAFRVVEFDAGTEDAGTEDAGGGGARGDDSAGGGARGDDSDARRRAIATWLESLAPNRYVVGIDPEREVMLVHELVVEGDSADSAGGS